MVGSIAQLPEDVPTGRLTQDTARLDFIQGEPIVPQFLYWVLRTPHYRQYCAGRVTGSVAASISREDFLSYPVPPMTSRSRIIIQVLEGMEKKRALNRRLVQTLEVLSRAIFRVWFVDFEPVKAKAAGAKSFPSMPQVAYDALSSRFADSELGRIPEMWKVQTLGDQCQINEKTVRRNEIKGSIEYVDIASVSEGRLDAVQPMSFAEAPSRARRRIRHGDTIWSCVRPNRRSYLFIHSPPEDRIVSTGFAVLSPKHFGPSYLHELTIQHEFVDYLVGNADGSAYPAVRPDDFAAAKVVVPPNSLIEAFEATTMPLRDMIEHANRESSKLAELREYLLPKLLSGAARVSVPEQALTIS